MKKIIAQVLILTIFSQQALAYSPSSDFQGNQGIELIESLVKKEPVSQHDFYQRKKVAVKQLNKQIKKLSKYTDESKINVLVNEQIKTNKKVKRKIKRVLRTPRLIRKIAGHTGMTYAQTKKSLKSKQVVNISEYRESLVEKSQEHGNIVNYLKLQRDTIKSFKYVDLLEALSNGSYTKAFSSMKSADAKAAFPLLLIVLIIFVAIPALPIVGMVGLMIGVSIASTPLIIGSSIALVLGSFLYDSIFG